MRGAVIGAVMLVGSMPTNGAAQSVDSLQDAELLNGVVAATEARDADTLLTFMVEVEKRELLMFKAVAQCDAVVPETGLLENMMTLGNARRAYIVAARQTAMSEGNCGCIFSTISFDTFSENLVGSTAPNLTRGDLDEMRTFRRTFEDDVDAQYRDFRQNTCGKS